MKALVKFSDGKRGVELRDIPKPSPQEDELLIKVSAAGVCGTDVHIMEDEYPSARPVVMGHEYTGIVEDVGSKATGFRKGDNVISLTAVVTCGQCEYCRKGLLMLCDERKSIGSGVNGAMAEYLVVPAHLAFKIPEDIQMGHEIALAEPLACCIRAVIEKSPIKAGDVVLVSGPGVIGQLTAQISKICGAFVILSGMPKDTPRLQLALDMGTADVVVNEPDKLRKTVWQYAPGGVDVVYECSGAAASLATCLDVVKKAGHYAQVGLFGKAVPVEMDKILTKELSFSTSYATEPTSWAILMNLLRQGKLDLAPLANPVYSLEDWSAAFDAAVNKDGYKVILKP